MYFALKSLTFIYIIPLYMFRTPLCPSSGASQLRMQSLVSINYKNTCCLQICRYVHFIITTNYLCDMYKPFFNPLNPELNPICYLLALLGAHHFLHVSRIRVKLLNFRRLMSYIYGAPILDVSRSHTTTQHSR